MLLSTLLTSASTPTRLSSLLSEVPLARRSTQYYGNFIATGEFGPSAPQPPTWPVALRNVLELSAGQNASWSSAVATSTSQSAGVNLCAADLKPPICPEGPVECIAVDNTNLAALAAERAGSFDLLYASHALCTCRWPLSPTRYAQARACACGGDGAASNELVQHPTTCGGIAIEQSAVDDFVAGVASLLKPGAGVAIFDQEGGWSWGLETLLRDAARAHGLHFYTRRGPLWTNFDYVLSAKKLADDVSTDVLQRSARATDTALVLYAPAVLAVIYAANHGMVPPPLLVSAEGVQPATLRPHSSLPAGCNEGCILRCQPATVANPLPLSTRYRCHVQLPLPCGLLSHAVC